MAEGFIFLHRQLASHDLWLCEKFTRGQAWVDLLMLANHTDGIIRVRGLRITIRRGQVGYSEVSLATRWKWSRGRVRRFMQELIHDKMITVERDNKTSIITISNYDQYQLLSDANSTADKTANSTADGQQTDTNKNGKNEKKKDKKGRNTSCGQPAETAVLPPQVIPADAIVSMPLNTGDAFPITAAKVEELAPLYPAVDVTAELRKMAGWLIGNPTHRKTRAGIMRFVTAWLSKAQDKGGTSPPPGQLRANTVYQQRLAEGEQKANLLRAVRRDESHGQETGADLAHAGGLALRPEADGPRAGGACRPLA